MGLLFSRGPGRFRKKDSGIQGYDCFCILARSFVDTVKELGVVGVNYGAFLFGNHSRFSGWSEDEKRYLITSITDTEMPVSRIWKSKNF